MNDRVLPEEREHFVRMLNQDAEPDWTRDWGNPDRPAIENPCVLCGWTLMGHQYVYGVTKEDGTWGSAHLHCDHTLRGAKVQRLTAENERLNKALGDALVPLIVLHALDNGWRHPRLRRWWRKLVTESLRDLIGDAIDEAQGVYREV